MDSGYFIGETYQAFVKAQIASGRYNSETEVLHDALTLLQEQEQLHQIRQQRLRNEIAKGINSGPGIPAEKVFAELRARYQKMADDEAGQSKV